MSPRITAFLALGLLALAAYSNSFGAGFPFDNRQLILQDARVHEASSANVDLILHHTYWWPYGESGLYRPVTTLSYLFNYAVLGNADRPAGYHWFNLTMHMLNVLLAYALMLRLTGPAEAGHHVRSAHSVVSGFNRTDVAHSVASGFNRTGVAHSVASGFSRTGVAHSVASGFNRTGVAHSVASGFSRTCVPFATAAIWAVVPLSTEAVANIAGRADLLAALAVLSALLMYLKGRDAAGSRRFAWFAGVMTAATLGFFSKESAVVIVPVIALYEIVWWTRGRSASALLWASAVIAPPLLLMWSQRSTVLGASPAAEFAFLDNPIVAAGFWAGRLTAIKVMARYLALLAWPATLSSDYSYAQIPLVRGTAGDWIACLAVAACAAVALALFRRHRAAFFFAAFAFATFLPASNLLFLTGTIMAERLMYLPSLGLVAMFAIAVFSAGRARGARLAPIIVVALVVVGFSYRTWTRNTDWQSDVTLWTSAVHAVPASAKAHRALAEALYDSDPTHANIDQVIAEAEQSLSLLSAVPDQLNSFHSYRQAGAYDLDKADELRRAAQGDAHAPGEAARAYQRALTVLQRGLAIVGAGSARVAGASVEPEADVSRLLAAAYLGLDDGRRALEAANRARALGPLHPLAYRLAADALLVQHRPDEAAVALMVGSIVTDDVGLGQALVGLYRSGFDEQGCAVVITAQGPVLNPSCALVRQHFCEASAEAVGVNLRLGRRDRAERARAFAAKDVGCR